MNGRHSHNRPNPGGLRSGAANTHRGNPGGGHTTGLQAQSGQDDLPYFPLPQETAKAIRKALPDCANAGLILQKYIGVKDQKGTADWKMKGNEKRDFIKDKLAASLNKGNITQLVKFAFSRRKYMLEQLNNTGLYCCSFTARTRWRMVVGLGTASTLETGMTMHPVYGCPYIPGSSLKGMTRSWAEKQLNKWAQLVNEIFGPENAGDDKASRGRVIFLDALPEQVPSLEADIINSHYSDYYMSNDPPADWFSPVPVYFIAVKANTAFHFAVASSDQASAEQAAGWLKQGLDILGIGSKTMVGYGHFDVTAKHE